MLAGGGSDSAPYLVQRSHGYRLSSPGRDTNPIMISKFPALADKWLTGFIPLYEQSLVSGLETGEIAGDTFKPSRYELLS